MSESDPPPFTLEQKVLFKHCDPAGIVFYPRYFEMMNDLVEAFFDVALGAPFERLHRTHSVPTVTIRSTFHAPSRHGDRLALAVAPTRIGGASMDMVISGSCGGEARFDAALTLVHIERNGRPERWPDAIRTAASAHLRAPEDDRDAPDTPSPQRADRSRRGLPKPHQADRRRP